MPVPARYCLVCAVALLACSGSSGPSAGEPSAIPLRELERAAGKAPRGMYEAVVGQMERQPADGPRPSGEHPDRVAVLLFRPRSGECEPGELTGAARAATAVMRSHNCGGQVTCAKVLCVGATRGFRLLGVDDQGAALWGDTPRGGDVAMIRGTAREVTDATEH